METMRPEIEVPFAALVMLASIECLQTSDLVVVV